MRVGNGRLRAEHYLGFSAGVLKSRVTEHRACESVGRKASERRKVDIWTLEKFIAYGLYPVSLHKQ
jgi:hypothetical protein